MPSLLAALPLSRILALDALTCAAMAAVLILGSGPIAGLTELPASLLVWAGVLLIPVALFIGWTARVPLPSRTAVTLIVVGNVGWSAASLVALLVLSPNVLGLALVIAQAAAVLLFAWLESRPAAARQEMAQ